VTSVSPAVAIASLRAGHAHQDDADTLAHDVAMKLAVWDRPGPKVIDERLASQPSDWRLVRRIGGMPAVDREPPDC
jgi:hypothetical protein